VDLAGPAAALADEVAAAPGALEVGADAAVLADRMGAG
jgi:hypothetical protein